MAKSKLSQDEATEFSSSLGKAATGDYELMDFAINTLHVPEALGMDAGQWVESIGGYVRRSVEQRREAVRELDEDGKSDSQIATILGISKDTVKRDRAVLALSAQAPNIKGIGAGEGAQAPKASVAEQRPQIRSMIDAGKTNAEIALALNRGVATIQKERTAYRDEKALEAAQREKAQTKPSPASQKAAEAEFGEYVSDMKKSITEAFGITPLPSLMEADEELRQVLDNDADFDQFDEALRLWSEIGRNLWVYGAKRGHDVSGIVHVLQTLTGEE